MSVPEATTPPAVTPANWTCLGLCVELLGAVWLVGVGFVVSIMTVLCSATLWCWGCYV
jgi:hypothetical protein